ncbi:hypothetical protein ACSBOB_04045 [Mesorhizobium sp. ASY16-5R]|uniref:hypothetical protein n=1 Tax=Mesorhizobium sp. ASY16-5R TaxID=3445772 RepID=UPI003FA017CA
MIPMGAVVVTYASLLPSAAIIAVSEFFGWRGWLTYAAASSRPECFCILAISSRSAAGLISPQEDCQSRVPFALCDAYRRRHVR